MSKLKPRLPLTAIEQKMLDSLSAVIFLPGSKDKRFYKDVRDITWFTEKQKEYLIKIFHKYRRQIGDYQLLAMELHPESFAVQVDFENTLFGIEANVQIKDSRQ